MPVNSFSCHIQQARWKAPSPSPSPRWSPGKYSLSFQLQNTELRVPDLLVFQRSPLTPQKQLHLFWRYWALSLLNLWVLQVQLLVYFDDATRLQWKIPLPPSSFLLLSPLALLYSALSKAVRPPLQHFLASASQSIFSLLTQFAGIFYLWLALTLC